MPDLSIQRDAQRLRVYIGESDRWRGKPLEMALLETFRAQGLAGATVFRGQAGFGAHSRIRTASIEILSMDLPVVIEVIDSAEKITAILDVIYPMVQEGLITTEAVQIVKYTHRYLNPLPTDRLVAEVMTQAVARLYPETPVGLAWKSMLEKSIKAMPVVDAQERIVGILTDEDLLERAGIQQRLSIAIRLDEAELIDELKALEASPIKVQDVMSQPVVTVVQTETLGAATAKLIKTGLKRLPVLDDDRKLVGIISRLDVLRQVANIPQVEPPEHLRRGTVKTVGDIMSINIPMVHQDDDLSIMIEKFSLANSHRLIVTDTNGKVIGLISDSDVITRVQPSLRKDILHAFREKVKIPAGKIKAFDLMSKGPLTAHTGMTIVEATKLMLAESRKWLVVTDDQSRPLGIVDRQILLEGLLTYRDSH